MKDLASALYVGWVRHRRFTPKAHSFRYPVFMVYLDLEELDQVLTLHPFWSTSRYALARFRRADFHGDSDKSLLESVRDTVEKQTGERPTGAVRLLANWRYWGFNMNPLCTYYCYRSDGSLQAIVAEVTNTPWKERHAYVLPFDGQQQKQRAAFTKEFHVSPFNPLAMNYRWYSNTPGQRASIHLENWQLEAKVMDATLSLKRQPMTARNMSAVLIRFPLITVKVAVSIYWQALKLWLKGVPYVPHPNNRPSSATTPQPSAMTLEKETESAR